MTLTAGTSGLLVSLGFSNRERFGHRRSPSQPGLQEHAASAPTLKKQMAAIRMFFSWLTEKGVLAMNPAREVKTPRFSRKEGKTPAFARDEVRLLLDSIDISDVIGHRDKALFAILAYTCSRIGAVVNLKVEDYFQNGKRSILRLGTKGGKENEFPVNHVLEEILDAYLQASGLLAHPTGPLFQTTRGKSRELGNEQ